MGGQERTFSGIAARFDAWRQRRESRQRAARLAAVSGHQRFVRVYDFTDDPVLGLCPGLEQLRDEGEDLDDTVQTVVEPLGYTVVRMRRKDKDVRDLPLSESHYSLRRPESDVLPDKELWGELGQRCLEAFGDASRVEGLVVMCYESPPITSDQTSQHGTGGAIVASIQPSVTGY